MKRIPQPARIKKNIYSRGWRKWQKNIATVFFYSQYFFIFAGNPSVQPMTFAWEKPSLLWPQWPCTCLALAQTYGILIYRWVWTYVVIYTVRGSKVWAAYFCEFTIRETTRQWAGAELVFRQIRVVLRNACATNDHNNLFRVILQKGVVAPAVQRLGTQMWNDHVSIK